MIEVNLLPGGKKRTARGSFFAVRIPRLEGGLPSRDPWILAAAGAVLVALVGTGWLFTAVAGEADELEVRIESAVRDSLRFADIIERSGALQARRDSIADRVGIIQEIDGSRYMWAHLMDEVGRAVPDYIWLTRFFQVVGGEQPTLQIEGRAGTYFALTTFLENLEASPFMGGVRLIASEQATTTLPGGVSRLVYQFVLEATRREPPAELVETVPLFGPSVLAPDQELAPPEEDLLPMDEPSPTVDEPSSREEEEG